MDRIMLLSKQRIAFLGSYEELSQKSISLSNIINFDGEEEKEEQEMSSQSSHSLIDASLVIEENLELEEPVPRPNLRLSPKASFKYKRS